MYSNVKPNREFGGTIPFELYSEFEPCSPSSELMMPGAGTAQSMAPSLLVT